MSGSSSPVTILGIGNPIMGDDGVGIAVLEELASAELDGPADFVDGGTIGMSLLPIVADSESLLLLDAVAESAEPGTVVRYDGDQLPRYLHTKLSPHQVGLVDVLAGVRLLGTEPRRVALVGVVPADVDLRAGLSDVVAAAVPAAVAQAKAILAEWWAQ
jgi:hydrogenase maturation protease